MGSAKGRDWRIRVRAVVGVTGEVGGLEEWGVVWEWETERR